MEKTVVKKRKKQIYMSRSFLVVKIIVFILFVIYAFSLIYPVYYGFITSLKTQAEYRSFNTNGLPKEWLFSNYSDAFTEMSKSGYSVITMFINSLWYTLGSTVLAVLVSTMTAYVVAKYRFPGRWLIYGISIFVMMIPIVGAMPSQFRIYSALNIIDSPFMVITFAAGVGFNFIVLFSFFQSLSWEYAEAAFVDGASDFRVFVQIMLPQTLSVILALCVVASISFWNDYMGPLLFLEHYPTIATGCTPGKTGILGNAERLERNFYDWVLDHKFVKVPDIFDAAKAAGLTTAGIFWPVTGNHKNVDYLINEWPGCAPNLPIDEALATQGSSAEMQEIARMYAGEMVRTGVHPGCDYFVADCAAEIIRRHAPDLTMIHPANVDAARHGGGVFGKEVDQAVRETDDMIGIVCRAMEAAGYAGKFNFILVSDHGQLDMKRVVNVNTLFADLGWIEEDEDGNVKDWKAWGISQGLSSYVLVKDPTDEKFLKEAERSLREMAEDGLCGFGEILNARQARERYGLGGNFSFVIETDGFTGFGDEYRHPSIVRCRDLSDYRQGWATHGHMPEKGPQPVFCAKGPSFKENFCGEAGKIYDLAPTLARVLGIPFYECDGKVLENLMK